MSIELNCSIEEFVERVVDEKLDVLTARIERQDAALDELTEHIERQDGVIAKLRAEISASRPKPIARRGVDIDTVQVDLR